MSYLAKLSNGILLESDSLKTVYKCALFEMRNEIDRSGLDHPYRSIDAVITSVLFEITSHSITAETSGGQKFRARVTGTTPVIGEAVGLEIVEPLVYPA